jgi:osmotically inducible protein OsmC
MPRAAAVPSLQRTARPSIIAASARAHRAAPSNKENDMAVRSASAVWNDTLKQGNGSMKLGSGAFEGAYSFASRFEEGKGTNPEELIGAALAGCFSMFLAAVLEKAGHKPTRVATTAKVHLGEGPRITLIELTTEAAVPGIDEKTFQDSVTTSKENCPVSRALAGPEISVNARLVG